MSIAIWARPVWEWFHATCSSPDASLLDQDFWSTFGSLLPCEECAAHFARILVALPYDPVDPVSWSVEVHNRVNALLGKPRVTLLVPPTVETRLKGLGFLMAKTRLDNPSHGEWVLKALTNELAKNFYELQGWFPSWTLKDANEWFHKMVVVCSL